jgi:excinuclease ABC subunit A
MRPLTHHERTLHSPVMSKSSAASVIRLRGVRHNNLKNFDIDLPLNQLIVITGPSGSGKSSLAFDTLYAEGQRRYIETFSPYARQFFDRMDKPQVDLIQGIPPAIAIEQRNTVKTTRSTVGTMTEICDYMKVIWSHLAELHCRQCGERVRKEPPAEVWKSLIESSVGTKAEIEVLITFDLPLTEKISLAESLDLVAKQGYQRVLLDRTISSIQADAEEFDVVRIEEAANRWAASSPRFLRVLQDRLKVAEENRSRFVEACEQAYHFGKGKLSVRLSDGTRTRRFSNRFHCASCDLEFREPASALFSFNHPLGACPKCRGFGRVITIDYNSAIPDRSLTLAEGAVKPWQTGQSAECQQDLAKFCRKRGVPMNVAFDRLSRDWQDWVLQGETDYGKDAQHQWPHAWYGIKGYFRWLESKAYKMHVRVLLSRYRTYQKCPDCDGRRFQPESLQFQVPGADGRAATLADFYRLPVDQALQFVEMLAQRRGQSRRVDPFVLALDEVRARLGFLSEVGLGYLSLDRPTRSLSGGETERVNLTTCLGSRLVNTLFVLDEPSVGLHHRDTVRLVKILQRLRDAGNTVVVVEHEASVMKAANQIVDLGPGHGESGGELVFQGPYRQMLDCRASLTGGYLSGRRKIEIPPRRPIDLQKTLILSNARLHNLKDVSVSLPLGRFLCVTGVSGSGKTTLVREVLLPCLEMKLKERKLREAESESSSEETDDTAALSRDDFGPPQAVLAGVEHLGRAVLVDQSPIGKTPRSNPAVYTGAFDHVREFFAQLEAARQRGLNASAFSFNSAQGQCELCRGAGFEKVEMQFLSDVYIQCPDCHGRRYRSHILELTIANPAAQLGGPKTRPLASAKKLKAGRQSTTRDWSIADVLDATVDEAISFLSCFTESRHAQRAIRSLSFLQEVGLGYLRLGQPINTLSGGESQRLKLVSHLAAFAESKTENEKPTLFLFDEPTTGLHCDDVRVLLQAFQRLVDAGHSVLVIEHNLDVIKTADWIVDLGPEGGEAGGQMVIAGTPEQVAECSASHTGAALREHVPGLIGG